MYNNDIDIQDVKTKKKNKIIKIGGIVFGLILIVIAVVLMWPKPKVILSVADYQATILKGAQTYAEKNRDLLDVDLNIDGYAYISFTTLINENYLDASLIDPSTESTMDTNQYVKVTLTDDELSYEITKEYVKPTSFAKYLLTLVGFNSYTMYNDQSNDNNIRYNGSTPNNYIYLTVNGQNTLFRIIGIMNNIDNGNGKLETRVKVVSESVGVLAWSTSNSNNWSTSSLNNYLNTTYLSTIAGLNKENAEAIYYLGGNKTASIYASAMYLSEHATKNGDETYFAEGNPTNWTGVIAPLYASDYGYASGLKCSGTASNKGYQTLSGYSDTCYATNWLYSNRNEWLLTPLAINNQNAMLLTSNGTVADNYATTNIYDVRATFYLPVTTKYISGDGTKNNPYVVEYK